MVDAEKDFFSQVMQADRSSDETIRWNLLTDFGMQVFATPDIALFWESIRKWGVEGAPTCMPLLIKVWLAFLCGDAAALTGMRTALGNCMPETAHEQSLLHAFRALSTSSALPEEKLHQAELAVSVLHVDDTSVFMANAKLTLAQMLSGLSRYRHSFPLFQESAELFLKAGMHFPAAVACTNSLLNQFRLGNHHHVLDEGRQVLANAASFRNEHQSWWDVVQLPVGMAQCELGKPALAMRHLEAARCCIDRMKLFHMHGLLEISLFRALQIRGDVMASARLLKESEQAFSSMHHAVFDQMLASFRLQQAFAEGNPFPEADVEIFLQPPPARVVDGLWLQEEMLTWLTLHGHGVWMEPESMTAVLERLRFIGNRPQLQLFLIMTAELHLLREDMDQAESCLREAVEIWRETGGCAGFLLHAGRSFHMLRIVDAGLYASLQRLRRERASEEKPASMKPDGTAAPDAGMEGTAPVPGAGLEGTFPVELLTQREREILQLAAEGRNNKEIGEALYLGISTVKWHINRIFAKLGAENRVQAIREARARGQIPPS